MSDINVHNDGSVALVIPVTDQAKEFLSDAFGKEALMLGNGYAVEPRYLQPILDDLYSHGFEISRI